MANQITDVRVVFTADLKPFAEGLKAMLVMTASAGKQITPLLNMRAEVNTSAIHRQLQAITESTDSYIRKMAEAAGATVTLGQRETETGARTDEAGRAVERKGIRLNKMKREALETFGAISFLAQGILQLATDASGGDKQLQKMSQSMSQGISAGFGLAGVMSVLGIATGGTAVAIGAVVAVGVAMLNFFDQGEKKAEMMQRRMRDFSNSLKGASQQDLATYREALRQTILGLEKDIAEGEKLRNEALKGGNAVAFGLARDRVSKDKQLKEQHVEEIRKIEEQMTANQMTEAEVRAKIQEFEIQAVEDKFQRMHAEENKRFEEEKKRINDSVATDATKKAALEAAERAHQQRLTDIFLQEENDREQERKKHAEERKKEIEEQRAREKVIQDLSTQTTRTLIDADKARELAKATSARDKVAIEEKYALRVIELEEGIALASAQSEEERQLIREKFDALRIKLRMESGLKFLEAERTDSEKWKDTWLRNNSIIIDTIAAGWDSLWNDITRGVEFTSQLEIDQRNLSTELFELDMQKRRKALSDQLAKGEIDYREYHLRLRQLDLETRQREEEDLAFKQQLDEERKSSFERAWDATSNIALQALGEILKEEIKGAILSMATTKSSEASKTATVVAGSSARQTSVLAEMATTLASAAARIAGAVASAIEWQIATFGPFALLTIGASVAGIYALWEGVKKTLGFAQGGKSKPGQRGFIEGFTPEIIAPEKDFYDIARAEMIPKMLLMTAQTVERKMQSKIGEEMGGGSGPRMLEVVERFERAIDRFENKEFEIFLDRLVTGSDIANEKRKRAGIK